MHSKNGRFINPHLGNSRRSLRDVLRWFLGHYDDGKANVPPPAEFSYPADAPPFDAEKPAAMWLGHSTYLIQANGLSLLTDPVFSLHCSPIPFRSLKRRHETPIALADLPAIDLILISHNHYDHLDAKTVRTLVRLHPEVLFVVPQGVKSWFLRRGIESVIELGWGDAHPFPLGCRITAVPAQHFSGRSLWDQNKTLWCGYVVEWRGKTFYFAGDTGYNLVDFKEIGRKFPAIDLSLIPIGAYVPEAFMAPVHINPEKAVQIHEDVGSKLSLATHWHTFALGDEHPDSPPYDLCRAMAAKNIPFERFLPIRPGEQVNW